VKSDDLAPLFGGPDTPEILHVGTVLAWDPNTGANTVLMAGAPVNDLPMLNIGDTTNLAVGDTVVILKQKSAFFILGRVVAPHTSAIATAAVAFGNIYSDSVNFTIATSDATVGSFSFVVPAWANQALVSVSHDLVALNATATRKLLYTSVWITAMGASSSQNTELLLETGGGLSSVLATAGASLSTSGPVTPGATITVEGRGMCFPSAVAASAGNQSHLTGFAIFSRI
jgi:hypothetical protein